MMTEKSANRTERLRHNNLYLGRNNYLDASDPFEYEILELKENLNSAEIAVHTRTFPTAGDQRVLVADIQRQQSQEDRLIKQLELIKTFQGYCNVVALPFKTHAVDNSQELYLLSSHALLIAADSYPTRSSISFTNFAAPYIQSHIATIYPNGMKHSFLHEFDQPMIAILRFLSTIIKASDDSTQQARIDQIAESIEREYSTMSLDRSAG
jgi:hypothetical protein